MREFRKLDSGKVAFVLHFASTFFGSNNQTLT